MAHVGVELAIGIIGTDPPISKIVRKQRHHKFSAKHLGSYPTSQFSKPNHHELLTDLQVAIQVDSSEESAAVKLVDRIAIALSTPAQITRFGSLSLGESWAMVNGVRPYRETDGTICWLIKDNRGLISLPVWIDRQTTQGTFQRFSISETGQAFTKQCQVPIKPPVTPEPVKATKAKRSKKAV